MIPILESFSKHKNKFLIHEHIADRVGLHYDIRIEHNGKLESWACRHLPSLIDGVKKKILIIEQDPHELNWFDWEGKIEDGYGKGKLKIWDKGSVKKLKWTDKHKIIEFIGTKIRGKYNILHYPTAESNQFLMFPSKK